MEQLIFFAVLVIFSILESIAKKRRQQRGGGLPTELPEEPASEYQWPPPRRGQAEPPRTSVPPSYDEDASFDARLPAEEARSLEARSYDELAAAEAERRRRQAPASESMIPAELWEEIAGLAREAKVERPSPPHRPRPQPLPKPQPRRTPQGERPAAKAPTRTRPAPPVRTPPAPPRRPEVERRPDHPVHVAHRGFGTDPSERAASVPAALEPIAAPVHADAAAVRERLRSRSAAALRQAVILQEVLGPPAAIRPDRFEE